MYPDYMEWGTEVCVAELPQVPRKSKPIDRWLALTGIAMGIVYYLLPSKTPLAIMFSLTIIFGLLIHPIWNFWWIEVKLWRKVVATLLFVWALIHLGRISWPSDSSAKTAKHDILALGQWFFGPHGRWFDKAIGAFYTLAIIFLLLVVTAMVRVVKLKRKANSQKGFLEYKLEAEKAMRETPEILEKLTNIMNEVTPAITAHTAALLQAGSTEAQLKVSKQVAVSFNRYSLRIDRFGKKCMKNGSLLSEGLLGWSIWIRENRPPKASFGNFPDLLRGLSKSIGISNESLAVYINAIVAAKGMSSNLNSAIDKYKESWVVVLETNKRVFDACNKAVEIFDGLP